MGTTKFNGWQNYETWVANLWLSNDQGTYDYWREMTREVLRASEATGIFTRAEIARNDLAERLEKAIQENNPCTEASLYSDLLNGAIAEIDWHEVATAFLEDIAQDEEIKQDPR